MNNGGRISTWTIDLELILSLFTTLDIYLETVQVHMTTRLLLREKSEGYFKKSLLKFSYASYDLCSRSGIGSKEVEHKL